LVLNKKGSVRQLVRRPGMMLIELTIGVFWPTSRSSMSTMMTMSTSKGERGEGKKREKKKKRKV
jgi:hypothetical protein